MASEQDPLRIEASPEKRFFIDMLVKDIELIPAVLDLVDNSVDGARAIRGDGSFDGLAVNLTVDSANFDISDNCGGIDLDVARNYAFRFGRPSEFQGVPGSVGQFGVGMKRALFKIGRAFTVKSRTTTTSFEMDVDVDVWASEEGTEWAFHFRSVDPNYSGDEALSGTEIGVTRLHESVSQDFGNSAVVGALRAQLQLRHQGALSRGMTLTLNGELLRSFVPALQASDDIRPIHKVLTLDSNGLQDSGLVSVRLYAGVVPGEREGEREPDDGDAEQFRTDGEAGWYLFCNGRLLLAADRTSLTGWGTFAPAYHPQFRRFRGYVFLESLNQNLLPWNTTKTGVDQDSRVWRQVASEMKLALAEVCGMLTRVKGERQSAESDDERPITLALQSARPAPLDALVASPTLKFPEPPAPRPRPPMRKIQYNVDRSKFDRAADTLGTTNASEIGRQTFDHFYRSQVDEVD